jgi:HEAT repeat protein
VLSKNPQERAQQAARLSRLLDSDNALARRLAARLLGRSEDLTMVPDLIYALTDNDSEVPKLAEEGLRLLSRHLNTVHLKQNPTDEQKAAAVRYWKQWYLGLRPDFVFIDRE